MVYFVCQKRMVFTLRYWQFPAQEEQRAARRSFALAIVHESNGFKLAGNRVDLPSDVVLGIP